MSRRPTASKLWADNRADDITDNFGLNKVERGKGAPKISTIKDLQAANQRWARFVLAMLCDFDVSIYEDVNDPVRFRGLNMDTRYSDIGYKIQGQSGKNDSEGNFVAAATQVQGATDIIKWSDMSALTFDIMAGQQTGEGTVSGRFGICGSFENNLARYTRGWVFGLYLFSS